jgi:RNA polymerase sigma-70 factor (ECF subfamily)
VGDGEMSDVLRGRTDHSDEELMAAYVAGDRAAFAELFRRYAPRLTRLMRRDMARDEDGGDLVQQTFLQLHRARLDFRAGAMLRPWLYTIALNLKRQYFRRLGRRPEVTLDPIEHGEPVSSDADAEQGVHAAELRRALRQLPDGQRQVIELHWFEGLTFAEVGQVVGAGTSAVKVRAHRGYAKLRRLLADAGVTAAVLETYAEQGREG